MSGMTAAQLRKAMERSGRSVRDAALELQIHERTLHRYLSGEAQIPRTVELVAARWLEHPDLGDVRVALDLAKEQQELVHAPPISLATPPKRAPTAGANAYMRGGKVFIDQSQAFGLERPEVIRLRDWLNIVLGDAPISGETVTFPTSPPPRTNRQHRVVLFDALQGARFRECAISYEALKDFFGVATESPNSLLNGFIAGKLAIHRVARRKLKADPGFCLITTSDFSVPDLS